ncbi:hypothetical protein ACJX0J_025301, partial [Zea mays]
MFGHVHQAFMGSSGGDVFCGWMIIGIEIYPTGAQAYLRDYLLKLAQKFSFLAYKRKVISENKCCGIILLHLDYILVLIN